MSHDPQVFRPLIQDMELALSMADRADQISLQRFRALDLQVSTKPDLSPVSDADLAVEDALRTMLAEQRPGDAVHGEERDSTGDAARRWVIDPIDGTKNFVRGVPVWATLIALMEGEEVILGLVSAPALRRRWWAAKGQGTWAKIHDYSPVECSVSGVNALEDASLSLSSLEGWARIGLAQQVVDLSLEVWRTRGYGDFWNYMLLAEGSVDIAAEADLELYDMAACAIIVTEAGGTFTNLAGEPGPVGRSAVASNGLLHQTLLERLTAGHH